VFYPSNPGVAFVTNSYNAIGRIVSQADANGNTSSFFFAGPRTEFIDPAGNRHVTYQSPRGKVITDAGVLDSGVGNVFNDTPQQNGLVNVARNQYDGQDRLLLATAPEGGTTAYSYSLPDSGSAPVCGSSGNARAIGVRARTLRRHAARKLDPTYKLDLTPLRRAQARRRCGSRQYWRGNSPACPP
jgi:hypothetical protein